jgi:hypothetical protein
MAAAVRGMPLKGHEKTAVEGTGGFSGWSAVA